MSDASDIGLQTAKEMLDDSVFSRLQGSVGSNGFGAKLGELSLDLVFGKVWTRAGLSRRDRSLVTLGILIALRQSEELKLHTLAALRNGATVQEIEEVLYQASGYAGFPAATSALGTIIATLREAGHLP